MIPQPVYLDANATTPTDPRVAEAILPWLSQKFGNASGRFHPYAAEAAAAVQHAREQVAALIGARPGEIVFTSGATESNNLALKGVAERYAHRGDHIVTCLTEHPATLEPCRWLQERGWRVTYLRPGADGRVTPEQVAEALSPETVLLTLQAANNETGVLQPLAEVAAIARQRGVLVHSDAAQAVGKVPVDVEALGVDLLSLSGHKFHGPMGVGALYVRGQSPRVRLAAQMHGGGQEQTRRSGTLNVPGIVGLGAACLLAREHLPQAGRIQTLRDRLQQALLEALTGAIAHGAGAPRLGNTLAISLPGINAESFAAGLAGDLAFSTGSACSSASLEPSHVLSAMGVPAPIALGSIRLSLSRFTTPQEVEFAAGRLIAAARAQGR